MTFSIESLLEELEEIDQNLIKSVTPLNEPSTDTYRGCSKVIEIAIEVNGEPAVLTVGFPDSFPSELPKFFDKDNNFNDIPHKESDGLLCFTRNESLIIDVRYPASILLNCLEKVIDLIQKGINGENEIDNIIEFEAYWRSVSDIYAAIDTKNQSVRLLNFWWKELGDKFLLLSAERNLQPDSEIKQIFHIDLNDCSMYRCIYFPLKPGAFFKPPIGIDGWDYQTLKRNIFDNLSHSNTTIFRKIVKGPFPQVQAGMDIIIIGLPLPNGNTALFGYLISGSPYILKGKSRIMVHPLIQKPKDAKMFQMGINRWHPEHLLNRTGGNLALTRKHILVVGTGSIGSEIALRLAKAGVQKISIIDYDVFKLENVHRHALGSDQVFSVSKDSGLFNKPKVWAIKEEISRKYPFTKVEMYNDKFIAVLKESKINWADVDMVFVAIGSPNQEMDINRKMTQLIEAPPVIYSWVEPLGIGGHTLVTLNGTKNGCYQCLFQTNGEDPIYNRSAFAKPFQEFSKTVTGCGSVFTPYNFLDSERTAILAVDTGIKVLMGEIKDNPLLSWKGEDRHFRDFGYEVTPRFSFSVEKLYSTRFLYKDPRCPVCLNEEVNPH